MKQLLIGFLVLALAGCHAPEKEEAEASPRPAQVEVTRAAARRVPLTVEAFGTLEVSPDRIGVVSSAGGGKVTKILAHLGDHVAAGQLVMQLQADPTIQAELDKARIAAQQAKRVCDREKALVAAGVSAAAREEEALSAWQTAKADLDLKQRALALAAQSTELRSPLSGVVTEASLSVGMVLPAQAAVMTIQDLAALEAEVAVPAEALPRVRPGQKAVVILGAGERLVGRVLAINRVLAADSQRGAVRVSLPSSPRQAQPEQFVRASIVTGSLRAVMVPGSAIVLRDGEQQVFVLREGRSHAQRVATGPEVEGQVAITSGVLPGAMVITQGAYELTEGAEVRAASHDAR